MSLAGLALAVLSLADARPNPDAGIPPWAPTLKPAHVEDAARYRLRRSGDGYVWENDKFEAHVARDGIVTFSDKRASASASAFSFRFAGTGQRRWERPGVAKPTVPEPVLRPSWALPSQSRSESAIPWDEVCPPRVPCYLPPASSMVEASGTFDLTDEMLAGLSQGLHRQDKARFLSATFEFRIRMATQAHKTDLAHAQDVLPGRLETLWNDSRYSAYERRRILYELWSELDETSEGERARSVIVKFIHDRLPCGAPDAYTEAEIEAFTRMHPEKRFRVGDCGR